MPTAKGNTSMPTKEATGAGRRGATKRRKAVDKIAKVVVPDTSDDEVDGQDVDALIEHVGTKLQFHIFNPDLYKVETSANIIIVNPEDRISSNIMTAYEYTEVVSNRARQIENGGVCFAIIGDETDPIVMAEMEIAQKVCPQIVHV